jgi:hypothetical protein
MPAEVTVPSSAFQITVVFEALPCTVAPNESVPPVIEEAVDGDTATEVTPDLDCWLEVAATLMMTVAVMLGLATLVAVIVPVPAAVGAVNTPAAVIDPIVADHVTLFDVAPAIAAVNWVLLPGAGEEAAGETTTEAAGAVAAADDDFAMPTHPEVQVRIAASKIRIP